jgi:quercetin dioxygenase-like cupin family protein
MHGVIPSLDDSALALSVLSLDGAEDFAVGDAERDSLLYVAGGTGSFALDDVRADLTPGTATLVLAGEAATLTSDGDLKVVHATAGRVPDSHASLGPRETVVQLNPALTQQAFGSRAYQVLFGPHNGSVRATLFVGFLPPGRAPWHYHLYDEIVWIPEGPGRLHRRGSEEPLGPGSAFRLRAREVHIVENASADRDMSVLGFFSPAGSPSAAYIPDSRPA